MCNYFCLLFIYTTLQNILAKKIAVAASVTCHRVLCGWSHRCIDMERLSHMQCHCSEALLICGEFELNLMIIIWCFLLFVIPRSLFAMGLDQFGHLPTKYSLIRQYLLPTKTTTQLVNRFKNLTSRSKRQTVTPKENPVSVRVLTPLSFMCNQPIK